MDESSQYSTSTGLLNGLHQADNHALWREFDARYRPIILGFARRLGLRDEDAADAAQESLMSFLKGYREGNYDRSRGRLRAWLMTIVRRRVIDIQRAKELSRPARGSSAVGEIPDEGALEALWESERRSGLLRQAMEELRKTSRTSEKTLRAFDLYVLQERPVEAVAEELQLSPGDVYMAKNRVAERLREIVARLDKLFDDG